MGKKDAGGKTQGACPILPDISGKPSLTSVVPRPFPQVCIFSKQPEGMKYSPSRGGAAGCKQVDSPNSGFHNCDQKPTAFAFCHPGGPPGPFWSHSLGLREPGNWCKLAASAPAVLWVIKVFLSHPASMKQQPGWLKCFSGGSNHTQSWQLCGEILMGCRRKWEL